MYACLEVHRAFQVGELLPLAPMIMGIHIHKRGPIFRSSLAARCHLGKPGALTLLRWSEISQSEDKMWDKSPLKARCQLEHCLYPRV
jgi:hypothetical protein